MAAGLEGRTLDRYELRQLLGRGGMADVYLAYDPHFDREVAVKVFKREDEDLLRRFIREAHLMASLSNSNLIPVYDAGMTVLENIHVYYIVMPFMEGETLRARIRHNPLAPSVACRYLRDIANALDYLHQQGIIHRDIKSSNVLLDADDRCYLSDFGIARTETDSQMTSTGNVLGTVDYIAPELFETNQRANAKSDLYSLGVLLFEMVTGELPFTGENQIAVVAMHVSKRPPSPRSYVPSLSSTVERVVYKALEKRPEQRYSSAGMMADVFCRAAANRPIPEDQLAEPLVEPQGYATLASGVQGGTHTQQMNQASTQFPATHSLPAPPVVAPATGSMRYYSPSPTSSAIYPPYQPSQPLPARRPPKKRSSRGAIVAVLALIAMLAVLGPAGYILYAQSFKSHPGTSSPVATQQQPTADLTGTSQVNSAATATQQAKTTATAQANAHASATAQATATQQAQANTHATATAQANVQASATTQANASATAGAISTATAGTPVYSDPLTNALSPATLAESWDKLTDQCTFSDDGYHVKNKDPEKLQMQVCHESAQQYANFAAKVNVALNSARSGGLVFRMKTVDADTGKYAGYLFEIDNQGRYRISYATDTSKELAPLQDWTASDAVMKGQANTLQLIANGGGLSFYANNTLLVSLQDTHAFNGTIGFLATSDGTNAGEAVYSNLNIYQQ